MKSWPSPAAFCALLSLLFIFFSNTPQLGVLLFIIAVFLELYELLLINEKREARETAQGVIDIINGRQKP